MTWAMGMFFFTSYWQVDVSFLRGHSDAAPLVPPPLSLSIPLDLWLGASFEFSSLFQASLEQPISPSVRAYVRVRRPPISRHVSYSTGFARRKIKPGAT